MGPDSYRDGWWRVGDERVGSREFGICNLGFGIDSLLLRKFSFTMSMETSTIVGEYYLEGVREMASVFLLNPDSEFEFFFSYGALDRQGRGKWEVKADRIYFNSRAKPETDFTFLESRSIPGEFIHIKVGGGDPGFLRHIFCSLKNGAAGSWEQMSQDGELQLPSQPIETISILWEFCQERFSSIPVKQPTHNEFIFRVEPSILELFLENFSLQIEPGVLTGRHPQMEGDQFRYAKQ